MAGIFSSSIKLDELRKVILKSIYYNQNIPNLIILNNSMDVVSSEINFLQIGGFIKKAFHRFELTIAGKSLMVELNGGVLPEMIDLQKGDLLPSIGEREFIVGGSLAESIFREARLGE